MGDEGSRRVVERVAEVIDRIGDARNGVESAEPPPVAGTDRSDAIAAVTDGGADEAASGNSPWAADDPIVFDEESEDDPGTAILEAVRDGEEESAPPFGDVSDDVAEADGDDPVAGDRLDELEARIGALETDHAQFASQMADVEDAVAGLGADVERVGDDVRELVTLLGGVALASEPAEEPDFDSTDVATELASELEDSAATAVAEAIENASVQSLAVTGPDVQSQAATGTDVQSQATTGTDAQSQAATDSEAATSPEVESESDDEAGAARNDHDIAPDAVPQGIHRGVDDAPTETSPARSSAEDERRPTASQSDEAGPRDASDRNAGQPSRELVDPRTDAVGARLRQFREGFVDDPTEDLPTGSSADEFRFEKVLLPTDGEHATDLSTDELEKPYLEALPDGYAADAVVLEWLDWLVSAADGETAARAIGYYESIDWLTDDVQAELLGYLDGLGEPGAIDESTPVGEPPAALDLQDHLRSLQYVTELATGEVDPDGI